MNRGGFNKKKSDHQGSKPPRKGGPSHGSKHTSQQPPSWGEERRPKSHKPWDAMRKEGRPGPSSRDDKRRAPATAGGYKRDDQPKPQGERGPARPYKRDDLRRGPATAGGYKRRDESQQGRSYDRGNTRGNARANARDNDRGYDKRASRPYEHASGEPRERKIREAFAPRREGGETGYRPMAARREREEAPRRTEWKELRTEDLTGRQRPAAEPDAGPGEFWLYGINPVLEALKAGRPMSVIYLSAHRQRMADDIRDEAAGRAVPVRLMHDPDFFDRKFPKGHQGVAAIARGGNQIDLDQLMAIPAAKGEEPFFVVVDLVEDPRNLGAVIRSAEAAGVHGVVIQERRAASPLAPEAIKASAGAAEHLPVCTISNVKIALRRFADEGYQIIGAEAGGGSAPWALDLKGPLVVVIGSEGKGLRRTVAEHCTKVVSLPMRGQVNSLNTSVAAGIILYEALRQRMK